VLRDQKSNRYFTQSSFKTNAWAVEWRLLERKSNMADIDPTQRQKLLTFAYNDARSNANGIGNECTHLIYAALFEAGAHDGIMEPSRGIGQSVPPYTWGKEVALAKAQGGDVVQYHGFQNNFNYWNLVPSNWRTWRWDKKRSPNHTAILFAPTNNYVLELESHLTDASIPKMMTRMGLVFYKAFNIIITDALYRSDQAITSFVDDFPSNPDQFATYLTSKGFLTQPFETIFSKCLVSDADYKKVSDLVLADYKAGKQVTPPTYNNSVARFLFQHKPSGQMKAYIPQASSRRMAMNAVQKDAEKQKLIALLIKGGRAGTHDGGDSKDERKAAGYFSWKSP
jgi:hypothetical protein